MRIILYSLSLSIFLLETLSCRQTIKTPVSEPLAAAGPSEVVPEGFVPLFNGMNVDGWTVWQPENQDWQAIEGIVDCNPHEGPGDNHLWTIERPTWPQGDSHFMGLSQSHISSVVARIRRKSSHQTAQSSLCCRSHTFSPCSQQTDKGGQRSLCAKQEWVRKGVFLA